MKQLWKTWSTEYLLSLRERYQLLHRKSKQSQQIPKVGDIVLIKENLPRGMWKLGKIVELIQSRDRLVRAAKVQLASKKIFSRALNHLYPLECGTPLETLSDQADIPEVKEANENRKPSVRVAAQKAKKKIEKLFSDSNTD